MAGSAGWSDRESALGHGGTRDRDADAEHGCNTAQAHPGLIEARCSVSIDRDRCLRPGRADRDAGRDQHGAHSCAADAELAGDRDEAPTGPVTRDHRVAHARRRVPGNHLSAAGPAACLRAASRL